MCDVLKAKDAQTPSNCNLPNADTEGLGCIDPQPPQPPEYWHMYSACASSDRSIN
jgi:hypothetical protein